MAEDASIGPVFLSASVPDPRRDPRFFDTADLVAIREAVRALAAVVLPRGNLVFGGHPAISPLIVMVARDLNAFDHVEIFQSEYFQGIVPKDSLVFPRLVWTPARATKEESLRVMRDAMIGRYPFAAGVFIGGMEGVLLEFELFSARHRHARLLPVASTGAAARIVLDRFPTLVPPPVRADLRGDVVYPDLFRRLLGVP